MEQEMKRNNNSDIVAQEIQLVNDMLKIAVDHGGDYGGPYFIYTADLKNKVDEWLAYKGYEKDYEAYIAESEYIQIRHIGLRVIEQVKEGFQPGELATMPNIYSNRAIFADMMTTSQIMHEKSHKLMTLSSKISDGQTLNILSRDRVRDINDKMKEANSIYKTALHEALNSSYSTIDNLVLDYCNIVYSFDAGIKLRFNNQQAAEKFINDFSDLLNNGKSVTVAKVYKLYGIDNIDIRDEQRGWRGEIKTSIQHVIEGDNEFYYAVIHDEPVKLF